MDLSSALTALLSTAGGGMLVVLVARAAIEKHLRSVDESARMLREVDRSLAVLSAHVEQRFQGIEKDLNNLGRIIREKR